MTRSGGKGKDIIRLNSPLKDGTNLKPIPVDKKCRVCKERKLLCDFDIDEEKKDKHATVCKSCKIEKEESHSDDECLECKFLASLGSQLEFCLALTQNKSIKITDEILDLMCEIMEQDEANKKDIS